MILKILDLSRNVFRQKLENSFLTTPPPQSKSPFEFQVQLFWITNVDRILKLPQHQ